MIRRKKGQSHLRYAGCFFGAEFPVFLKVTDALLGLAYLILGVCMAPLVMGSLRYTSPFLILMLNPHSGLVHTHAL